MLQQLYPILGILHICQNHIRQNPSYSIYFLHLFFSKISVIAAQIINVLSTYSIMPAIITLVTFIRRFTLSRFPSAHRSASRNKSLAYHSSRTQSTYNMPHLRRIRAGFSSSLYSFLAPLSCHLSRHKSLGNNDLPCHNSRRSGIRCPTVCPVRCTF